MKSIEVRDVYQIHGTASAIISRDELLSNVLSRFAYEPGLRSIFLVDSEDRFAGLITRIAILRWAQYQLVAGRKKTASSRDVHDMVSQTQAKSLARGDWRTLGVKENDSLQEALDQMVDFGEDVLPVLNEDGIILGDIRLSEILVKAIDVGVEQR
jgi:CBS-domain-containing membrane protein